MTFYSPVHVADRLSATVTILLINKGCTQRTFTALSLTV